MVRVMGVLAVIVGSLRSPQNLPVSCPRRRASSKRGHPIGCDAARLRKAGDYWVPAFAGTTIEIVAASFPFLHASQRRPDALRRCRHLVDLDAKGFQRVVDGVDD